ncbi:G-protein coupled receptor-associated protein LMBRD2-like isoform X2 [Clavelina lepadiformis]|uniref:G-protein coupled receptor-associated protein LMBRD2-like isoform X2 n=1 Tax=Clavelina lepadiformis TaxID=159417 RepID=UPI004042B1F6
MSVGPLIFELIVVFVVTLLLLHHYGRILKQHPVVTLATLVAWYFSLIIIFILPLDVSSTFYRQCVNYYQDTNSLNDESANSLNSTQLVITPSTHARYLAGDSPVAWNSNGQCEKPWSYVPENTLPVMWRIVYWTSQILTWLVLPFMQSYSCAGDFSTFGKMKRAVIENAVYYGSYLLLFGGLLTYVAVAPDIHLNIEQLKVILITASNTWGLFLLVLLLGYGLVEVPRRMCHAADLDRSLAQTHFKLAKLSTEKQEASEDLDDILEEIKRVAHSVCYNHPMRKFVNIIVSKCPENFQVSQGMDDYEDFDNGRSDISEKSLVKIHRQVIRAMHTYIRTTTQWKMLMKKALLLESISNSMNLPDRQWKEEYPRESSKNICVKTLCTTTYTWYWFCLIQPKLRKVVACCLAIFSLMVVWSECTFFNENPVLSLFAIFINLAKSSYNYFYIELASCLTISYLCVCAYYTVFRIKFFNYFYIAGHHQTDESSLLFVGIMLCRLTPPLCLNFLGMIHLDTHITGDTGVETSYTKIMGHLDVISFISDGFNIYFPILVCVLCIATYFNLGQRCLSVIGFQRFIDTADDMTTDLVDEGKQMVGREKRRLQREHRSLQRSERIGAFVHDTDMHSRQWSGRRMRKAEQEEAEQPSVQYTKRKSDKVELLDDVGPMDYSAVADANESISHGLNWENSGSQWKNTSHHKPRKTLSTKPPKNLFDDV